MSNSIYLFEHESIIFPWGDKELRAITKLNLATGHEVLRPTVRGGQRALQAREFVGLIRLGNQSINILPKIYQTQVEQNKAECSHQATHNLLHLLSYAGQIPIKEKFVAPLLSRKMDWFEILTRIFASQLEREWQLGVYRTYRLVESEETVLKGKWDIAKYIKRPDRLNRFPVSYDEFSVNNPLNRVLRYVVERLFGLTHDSENKRILGTLRFWLDEVSCPNRLSIQETDDIVITRLNERFEPLLNLAKIFLDDSAIQLASGDKSSFAFIFDMNLLFEAFVANFIRRYRSEIFSSSLEYCDFLPQAHGVTKYLAWQQDRGVFRMKPDIVFRTNDRFPIILDTKYKNLDPKDVRLGVTQADFYQMYAYSQSYQSKCVILLYPQTNGMNSPMRTRFNLENGLQEVRVETLDIRVDLSGTDGKQFLISQLRTIFGE